ncbi:hypothetical protein CEXT_474371 [Caerostris extrusa]|uniref:Uncharacterized protein n=1 Tax=Caerostris extrusa TaxID=172846 RepID=A0AAV4PX88_CAEEX|nr:hypothetical protein CEXT_474371 [Caerostris extrusa]
MTKRLNHMKTYKCFSTKTYDRNLRRVTAVYYHKGKVATASDSKIIQIWDCEKDTCLLTIKTDSSIASVKFDDSILIASSYLGHMVSWDAISGQRLTEYMRHNHSCWVLKVMLSPYPAEKGSKHIDRQLLFSLDKTVIVVRMLNFITTDMSSEGLYITTLYSIKHGQPDNVSSFIPGLYFDVLDKETLAKVALWNLPPSRRIGPDCSQLCLGETDWLDGLDGKMIKVCYLLQQLMRIVFMF